MICDMKRDSYMWYEKRLLYVIWKETRILIVATPYVFQDKVLIYIICVYIDYRLLALSLYIYNQYKRKLYISRPCLDIYIQGETVCFTPRMIIICDMKRDSYVMCTEKKGRALCLALVRRVWFQKRYEKKCEKTLVCDSVRFIYRPSRRHTLMKSDLFAIQYVACTGLCWYVKV